MQLISTIDLRAGTLARTSASHRPISNPRNLATLASPSLMSRRCPGLRARHRLVSLNLTVEGELLQRSQGSGSFNE
ncbi:hypothetical protein D9619_008312 [Psilocybe cf. subviscida]|uniref:Uncharacterized protein n=1 Tax=Psilocybe cf. subviscida TaxID=2480587 RepID=A0A8H5BA48_9AGAR|nr:hypothetical protein D9619_008312 [Psilocybe cf. subviscida]